jgi:hypothetical protein
MVEFFGFYVEGSIVDEEAPEATVDVWAVELHGFSLAQSR